MKFRTVAAVAALVAATAVPAPADLVLDVAPAKYELQIPAGKDQTIPITVKNSGDATVHVQATFSDFTVAPDGGYRFLAPGKGPYSMANWVQLNPREFDLEPGKFVQVRFSVNVPQGVKGEYSTIVFFTTRPPRKPGGVAIAERVASKIYEIVPDSEQFGGEVDDVSARPDTAGQKYLVGFHNTGNAHVYLSGRIEVKQGGQLVEKIAMPKEMLVERDGKRVIEAAGKKLTPGTYDAIAYVDFGGPQLVAGKTTFSVK